jgi:hypothetical protein
LSADLNVESLPREGRRRWKAVGIDANSKCIVVVLRHFHHQIDLMLVTVLVGWSTLADSELARP